MVDHKTNARADVTVLKIRSKWVPAERKRDRRRDRNRRGRERKRKVHRCSIIGARLEYSGSSNEVDDDNNVRSLATPE